MCLPENEGISKNNDVVYEPKLDAHNRSLWREKLPSTFTWSKEPEPHVIRRGQLLEKHPEIKNLYVCDPIWSPLFCLATCAVQIAMAVLISKFDLSWWLIVPLAWAIGGSMNHSLVLAMHELSHDLWFPKVKLGSEDNVKKAVEGGSGLGVPGIIHTVAHSVLKLTCGEKIANKGLNVNANPWFAFLINCPTCVASATTFKRYHLEHHSFQGSDKWDADIPTSIEGKLFNSTLGKLAFVSLQVFFYGIRPILTKPKPMIPMEALNWLVVGGFDLAIIYFLGAKALGYLFLGSILGLGLHPIAGHFIAEHFEFIDGQETYSYYGPLNWLTYNVGYHNEHHDVPKCCGRLLPLVKEVARTGGIPKYKGGFPGFPFGNKDWEVVGGSPEKASTEFYEDLPHYDSWTAVITGFIFGKNMNCFCRVKRGP